MRGGMALPDWRSILQSAFAPEPVQAPIDPQSRTRANVALENLSVIADRANDLDREIVVEAEAVAEIALYAQQPLDIRIAGVEFLFDIGLGNSRLFSIEQREVHPLDDCEPLRIALAHRRAQRLFGYYFGQHGVVLGVCLFHANRVEAGRIR